jgi:hypothetical protein
MKRHFLFISLAFVTMCVSAQNFRIPDGADIEKQTKDSLSPFYFPVLVDLFYNHPENLSADDYFYLYYGNAFREGFSGYGSVLFREISGKLKGENPDYQSIETELLELLLNDPVNLDGLYYLAYVYGKVGNEEGKATIYKNIRGLYDAILSSGDGLKKETAYWVTSVSDEYMILDYYGIEMKMQSLLSSDSGPLDYLEVKSNKDKIKGLYFNISLFFGKF